jgi:nucleotide-binding universal stress UspA family protein
LKTRTLFATNGARPARDAGILLRRLADPDSVEVTVNVCDSVEFAFAEDPWTMGQERRARLEPKDIAAVEVAAFRGDGFTVDSHIGSGVPADQILEVAREGNYDLTLLGAGSSSWLGNLLLGSTSTKVLHASESSILIVHRFQERSGKQQVLLATDGSEDSELAVATLLKVADPEKVSVTVVSVAEILPTVPILSSDPMVTRNAPNIAENEAQERADRVADRLHRSGFDVETECPFGSPAKEILKRTADAALVVLGSRGLGAAGRLIMGSVSEQVARLAPATLICRKHSEKSRLS